MISYLEDSELLLSPQKLQEIYDHVNSFDSSINHVSLAIFYSKRLYPVAEKNEEKAEMYINMSLRYITAASCLHIAKFKLRALEENSNKLLKEETFKLLLSLTTIGNPFAMYELGNFYLKVQHNTEKAIFYYRQAAEQAYTKAQLKVANWYVG